ncbi:hypothetical protein Vadar_034775 [Vaccinium darrowii]|uniref:Uncharacterized protein n=1 Tax=Vaccinium darrowii TaxID=229202 RepID=A0ACB7Y3Y2_9ERIC|nr:hypothetical protein Vadar_034775 [Vaccinium darrowii]
MVGWSRLISKVGIATLVNVWFNLVLPNFSLTRLFKQSKFHVSSDLDVAFNDDSGKDDVVAKNMDEMENHVDVGKKDKVDFTRAELAFPVASTVSSPLDAGTTNNHLMASSGVNSTYEENNELMNSSLGVEESVLGSGVIPDSFDENLNSNHSAESLVTPNYVATSETHVNSYINALGLHGVGNFVCSGEKVINDDINSGELRNEINDEGNCFDPIEIGSAEIRGWKEVLFVGVWRWHMEFDGELHCCVWSETKVLVGSQV